MSVRGEWCVCAGLWLLLVQTEEQCGARRDAFFAARRAAALMPESDAVQDTLLRLSDAAPLPPPGPRRKGSRSGDILSDGALPGTVRSIAEEQALIHAVDKRLSQFAPAEVQVFRRLSVFPQSFTPRQAEHIAGAAPSLLPRLVEAQLLRCVDAGDDLRFELPEAIRQALHTQLSATQRKRLRTRHLEYFARFEDYGWEAVPGNYFMYRWVGTEMAHLRQAIHTAQEEPLTAERMRFLVETTGYSLTHHRAFYDEMVNASVDRLQEAIQNFPRNAYIVLLSCLFLAEHHFYAGRFREAISHLRQAFAFWETCDPDEAVHPAGHRMLSDSISPVVHQLLTATHHAGMDDAFMEAYALAHQLATRWRATFGGPDQFLAGVTQLYAERLYARGDLEAALTENTRTRYMTQSISRQFPGFDKTWIAPHHYQRGCILKAMGKKDEALSHFDTALSVFREQEQAHGVADCYQQMGAILGERGLVGLARDYIERAINTYSELNERGSHAAALETLGDLLLRQGDREAAGKLYRDGLDYWRAQDHPSWTRHFEARLASVETKVTRDAGELLASPEDDAAGTGAKG
ncbi:MAG: hypothetical protein OHK0029_41300 [Armatimonadaceae bacterium]